jgi:NADH-quinone oxidoreductase subunit J
MLEAVVFYLFAAVMVGSALAILFSRNIVRSAIWLLATLGSAAGLYLLLSANYVAAIQLIVYAGGVLVLIIFGVMLTAKSPYMRFEPPPREVAIGVVVGVVLLVGLLAAILGRPWPEIPGAVLTAEVATVGSIGRELLTTYLVPFELVSVLLLAVMIGAAYLARPEKR